MDDMGCPGQRNFLGLSDSLSDPETSTFHVLPVPYDATATYVPGARLGPRAIIDASANLELYDHELGFEPAAVGIATLRELPVFPGDPVRMLEEIERAVGGILAEEKIPVILGGEHTVGLGALRALATRGDFMLVCLDAHADLRDTYQGTGLSHACYLRRASELVDCCAFGVRSLSREEARYAEEAPVSLAFAWDLTGCAQKKTALDFIPDNIYLSIDIDVLDPSIIPATGTPEPGGLGWYDTLGLLDGIIRGRRVLGFDVVELCPQPGNAAPDFAAAKLVYKVMGFIVACSENRREDWTGDGKTKVEEEASR
jgi:agmatinase